MYDVKIYLGKDRQQTAQHITATRVTLTELMRETEGLGYKLYMAMAKKQTCCCGTVRQNRRVMPLGLAPKTVKLKRGDFRIRTRADLTALLWWDKRDICTLTNIHDFPVEGSFCNEGGKVFKATDCD
jgi:hypothetical protein